MTAQTVGTTMQASQTPSVNLLPPEIAEAARFRRFQFAMGGVVAGAAVVVGFLYVGAHHSVANAQNTLTADQSQQVTLRSQVSALQSVSATYSQVASEKTLLSQAMGNEIRWSYELEDLSLRIPDSVWLTNMSMTETATSSSTATTTPVPGAATTPSVITPTDQVGTISFSGSALNKQDVAKWLNAISAERGWADPYVTTIGEATIGTRTVDNWTGTVDVTSPALSLRYTEPES